MEYIPTIGLEIHAELKTKTKMFCSSRNDADEKRPNVNICPVCLAHPGTLPVINKEAVKHVLRVGLALGGKLADYTEFDRKNYFYPDLPKGYQLSQYEYPLVSGGELEGVAITRVHLEEDTASSLHDEVAGFTTIDYNRAGVPLMELVTDPVITSAEQAGAFARELQLLLRYLGASEANMEKGEMRVEANVSVAPLRNSQFPISNFQSNPNDSMNNENSLKIAKLKSENALGTKVEIKNLNSFNAMERAVRYEIIRQTKLLEKGKAVVQETRGWDEAKQATFPQRVKEGSADYRYFPDPDLPSLRLSEMSECAESALSRSLPELPAERRSRYATLGLKEQDARILTAEPALATFFDVVLTLLPEGSAPQLAANYATNDLMNLIRDTDRRDTGLLDKIDISSDHFAKIIAMAASRRISSRVAKDLLAEVYKNNVDPERYAKEGRLLLKDDARSVAELVDQIIASNSAAVSEYKNGRNNVLEYLIGQGMRAARGSADPATLREHFLSRLQ